MDRLRCSTPAPPWRAMAPAILASVTVSIADETSGTPRARLRLSRPVMSASLGTIAECAGSSSTSSKVRAGGANLAAASVMSLSVGWLRDMLHPIDSAALLSASEAASRPGAPSAASAAAVRCQRRATVRRPCRAAVRGPPAVRSGDPLLARDRPEPRERTVLRHPDGARGHPELVTGLLSRQAGEDPQH